MTSVPVIALTVIALLQALAALTLWRVLPAWVDAPATKADRTPDEYLLQRGLGNIAGQVLIAALVLGALFCAATAFGA